jgi:hypothetical protein
MTLEWVLPMFPAQGVPAAGLTPGAKATSLSIPEIH